MSKIFVTKPNIPSYEEYAEEEEGEVYEEPADEVTEDTGIEVETETVTDQADRQ